MNGLIIQWVKGETSSSTASTGVQLPLTYSSENYFVLYNANHTEGGTGMIMEGKILDANHVIMRTRNSNTTYDSSGNQYARKYWLFTLGY